MPIIRTEYQNFDKRIKEPRRFIQVLSGPRQVGKTTMVLYLLERLNFPYLFAVADAVPNSNPFWIEQQWEVARQQWKQSGASEFLLVIDEIQKVDNWSETVKLQWDADTRNGLPIKLVLLGSSRLLLQQGLSESLAGRFESTYMGHWSLAEMHEAFGFSAEQFAWFGGYPGSADLISDENRWKRYVSDSLLETSISKDILMLTRVDKPALLRRLFELGCLYSGQIVSFTKILGQLQDAGNTVTLSHYLNLLDTAGLLGGLEKFSPETLRQRASSPKFQVHNSALISAQRFESFEQIRQDPTSWGRIVESSIGAHLLNHSISTGFNLYYWRNGNDEVDFVLEHKGRTIGLEIKSGATQKASGMAAFHKKYKPDKVLLVGTEGLPWQEFLRIKPLELF